MIETGYLDYLRKKYRKNYKITGSSCGKSSEIDSVEAFDFYKVVPLFTLLSIGFLASTLSLSFEIILNNSRFLVHG